MRFAREVLFALGHTADLRAGLHLIRETARFHLHNRFAFAASDEPFRIPLIIGGDVHPVRLRTGSGDLSILYEALMERCYHIPSAVLAPEKVRTIVDCGANIGLASLYLAERYRGATIYAVEPDARNFALLSRNAGSRIVPIHAAVVGSPRPTVRMTEHLKAWGNHITDADIGPIVPAITIDQLCEQHGFATIDLLKIDIEGGELELFRHPQFLRRVNAIIIELHNEPSRAQFNEAIASYGLGRVESIEPMVAATKLDDHARARLTQSGTP